MLPFPDEIQERPDQRENRVRIRTSSTYYYFREYYKVETAPLTELNFTHTVFGLTLRSNRQIPELPLKKQPDASPVVDDPPKSSRRLGLGVFSFDPEVLTYTSSYKDEAGNAALRIWQIAGGKFCRLEYRTELNSGWIAREPKLGLLGRQTRPSRMRRRIFWARFSADYCGCGASCASMLAQ